MYVGKNTMIRLLIVIAFVFTTGCAKLDFDGFDPTTATLRWIIKSSNVKRTSVHVTPRASLCTAIGDLRNTVGGRFGAFAPAGVRARKL